MLLIATAALLVLSTTAVADSKYNYGGRDSYEHRVYGREYKRFDPYESHYAEEDYREPHHDSYGGDAYSEEQTYTYDYEPVSMPSHEQSHEPRYRRHSEAREGQFFGFPKLRKNLGSSAVNVNIFAGSLGEPTTETNGPTRPMNTTGPANNTGTTGPRKRSIRYVQSRPMYKQSHESHYHDRDYRHPHHDSYDEDYYGGDAYSEEPSYTKSTYRSKRSAREGQQSNLLTAREAQEFPSCIGKCTTAGPNEDPDAVGTHVPCSEASLATGGRNFCYVNELCKDAKRSVIDSTKLWSTEACCGDIQAPCPGPDFGRGP